MRKEIAVVWLAAALGSAGVMAADNRGNPGAKAVENLTLEQALVALVSAMGDATVAVKSLAGTLDETFDIPALESLAANLAAQPEAAQAEAEIRARHARVELAKAERIPDVKVELLYHRLEATRSDTLDIGLSIPVPLFNRNQGRLREARAEVAAADARYEAGDISLAGVLPVRRDWAAVQLSYLESLREVMQAWGELSSY